MARNSSAAKNEVGPIAVRKWEGGEQPAKRPPVEDVEDLPEQGEGSTTGWPDWTQVPWHAHLEVGDARAGHPDSPTRNEERRLIKVTVESTTGQAICGQRAPHGTSFMLVYASDVPKVIAMLPTTKQKRIFEDSIEQYDGEFASFVGENGGNREQALATCAFRPETFYDIRTRGMKGMRGGYPALRALEVSDAVIPAPISPESETSKARNESNASIQELVKTLLHLTKGGRD